MKILIIGGHTKESFERKAKDKGIEIIFHSAFLKKKDSKKMFDRLVRSADCVIILLNACSHHSMWDVRDNKPIIYQKGLGVTRALERATSLLSA